MTTTTTKKHKWTIMTPEEAVEYYSNKYPKEKWHYSKTLKYCYSDGGKLGSMSPRKGLLNKTVDDIKDIYVLDVAEGIDYYSKILNCKVIYSDKYKVFVGENGKLGSVKYKTLGVNKNGILDDRVMNNGYLSFNDTTVHRVVYETYIGKIPKGYDIDHCNKIKTDNNVDNLRLLTHQANVSRRAHQPWSNKSGADHVASIPVLQCDRHTGKVIKEFGSQSEAARAVGRNQTNISLCLSGKLETCAGYVWKYKNPEDIEKRQRRGYNSHKSVKENNK